MISRRAGAINAEGFFMTVVSFAEQIGDTIVVHVSTTGTVSSVADDAGNPFSLGASKTNGSITVYTYYSRNIARAGKNIVVHFGGVGAAVAVEAYTGVSAIGNSSSNSGTGESASVSVTTQDANNVVAATAGALSSTGVLDTKWSASSPNEIFDQDVLADNTKTLSIAALDGGTVATPGTDTVAASINSSSTWAMTAIELRS